MATSHNTGRLLDTLDRAPSPLTSTTQTHAQKYAKKQNSRHNFQPKNKLCLWPTVTPPNALQSKLNPFCNPFVMLLLLRCFTCCVAPPFPSVTQSGMNLAACYSTLFHLFLLILFLSLCSVDVSVVCFCCQPAFLKMFIIVSIRSLSN